MKNPHRKATTVKIIISLLIAFSFNFAFAQVSDPTAYVTGKSFVPNYGQVLDTGGTQHPEILYFGSATGINYFIDSNHVVYSVVKIDTSTAALYDTIYRMDFRNIHCSTPKIITNDSWQGYINFYTSQFPTGLNNVPTFQEIVFNGIYHDIDEIFHIDNGFNFVYKVGIHGDPNDIVFKFDSALSTTNPSGKLSIKTGLGDLVYDVPFAAQYYSSQWNQVTVAYHLNGDTVSFNVGTYNHSYPLYIKVTPATPSPFSANYFYWSAFFGGGSIDECNDVVIDAGDNIYVVGKTYSSNSSVPVFPIKAALQTNNNGFTDAFVSKFNSNRALIWSTYYGGALHETGDAIGINSTGDVYFGGTTEGGGFFTCPTCSGYYQSFNGTNLDAYIIKLNSLGKINPTTSMATFFGGDDIEEIHTITIDANDNLFIGGRVWLANNANFPIYSKTGAYNQSNGYGDDESYLAEFDYKNARIWCTYIGGYTASPQEELNALVTDVNGNLYATGSTAAYGTTPNTIGYLTSPCIGNSSYAYFPVVDPGSSYPNAYLQDNNGGTDAYVIKFNSSGAIIWSTLFGGLSDELWYAPLHNNRGISVNNPPSAAGTTIFITGSTQYSCTNCTIPYFPVVNNSVSGSYNQSKYAGGASDGYIAHFDVNYKCDWSTLYGGTGADVCNGIMCGYGSDFWISGFTSSNPFPPNLFNNGYVQSYG